MSEAAITTKRKRSEEEDVTDLLQRYSPLTILSLLQEISEYTEKHPDSVKVDWSSLVKNTSTGICNAREYQMLWRNLAYHNPLLEKIEDRAEPLDDDSDVEFEVEALPAANPEDLKEAEECAKVILSTGSPRICGSTPRSILEASNGDTPTDQALLDPSNKSVKSTLGQNSGVPNPAPKQSSSVPLTEGLDNGPGGSNLPAKKKRQLWTTEEDMELIAAVQKCGEGNWANILKGDFKHNRTASQLSQRWALIRKRHHTNPVNASKVSSSARTEERLAAQKAFSMAVDMPMTGGLSGLYSGSPFAETGLAIAGCVWFVVLKTVLKLRFVKKNINEFFEILKNDRYLLLLPNIRCSPPFFTRFRNLISSKTNLTAANPGISSTLAAATSQASRASAAKCLNQFSDKVTSHPFQSRASALKKQGTPGKPLMGPNPSIQAAAFAAGGRIANQSTVLSLFKAAQSKNAVHIRPGGVLAGGSLPASSHTNKPSPVSSTSNNVGAQTTHLRQLRPSVPQPPTASFGTTLSSQRSSQPASLPSASATSALESKVEGAPGLSVQEKAEGRSNIGNNTSDTGIKELQNKDVGGGSETSEEGKTNCPRSGLVGNHNTVKKEDHSLNEVGKEQANLSESQTTVEKADKPHNEVGKGQANPSGSQSTVEKEHQGQKEVGKEKANLSASQITAKKEDQDPKGVGKEQANLSGSQITIAKENEPPKEVGKVQALFSNAGGSGTPDEELKVFESAVNPSAGDKPSGDAEVVPVQVNKSCSESTITANATKPAEGGGL